MKKTVYIKRSKIAEHISIASELVCLEYRSADQISTSWHQIVPNLSYDKTNSLVNEISDFFQKHDFFRIKETPLWQYLPSYIWPHFFAFNVFSEAIDRLLKVWQDSVENVHFVDQSEPDRYTALWEGLLKGILESVSFHRRTSVPSLALGSLKNCAKFLGLHHLKPLPSQTRRLKSVERGGIMFVSHARYFDYDANGRLVEVNFASIREELSSKFNEKKFVGVDCPYTSPRTWNDPYQAEDMEWLPFFAGQSFSSLFRFISFVRSFYFYFLFTLKRRNAKIFNRQLCRHVIWPSFRDTLPSILQIHTQAHRLVKHLDPRAVVAVYETGPYARALCIAASRRSIPTFAIMHGQIFDNHYDYMHRNLYQRPTERSKGFIIPNVFFAWGDLWKNILIQDGRYPENSVVVTGKISPQLRRQSEPVRLKHDQAPKEPHVLIMTAWYRTTEFLEAVFEFAKHRELLKRLVVKPHPSEDLEGIRATIARYPHLDIEIATGDLGAALAGSRLAIGQFSTTIFESALLKIPTVLFNFPRCQGASFFRKSLCWKYLETVEELSQLLDEDFEDFRKWTVEKAEIYRPMFLGESNVSPALEISRTIYSYLMQT